MGGVREPKADFTVGYQAVSPFSRWSQRAWAPGGNFTHWQGTMIVLYILTEVNTKVSPALSVILN